MNSNRLQAPFDGLNPEDRVVAESVKTSISEWIDERVTQLGEELKIQLDQATTELGEEIADMERELAQGAAEFAGLLQQFDKIAEDMEHGDGELFNDTLAKTRTAVTALQGQLQAREKRWKSLGASVVTRAKALAVKAIGL